MPSIINAATSGGLISTADTSGVLQLQTASTTALTIDASQQVGIGTASPAVPLDVSKAGSNDKAVFRNATRTLYVNMDGSGGGLFTGASQAGNYFYFDASGNSAQIGTNSAERMRIDSSGNVSVNTGNITFGSAAGAALRWQNGYQTITGDAGTDVLTYRSYTSHVWRTLTSAGSNTDGTERMRVNGNGIGLGAAVPSSGVGITFPATQSASSDANTLDDYEEGTWTPTVVGVSTYNTQRGVYTKIGKVVTVFGEIEATDPGTLSFVDVGSLPFSTQNTVSAYPIGNVFPVLGWSSNATAVTLQGTPGSTVARIYWISNGTTNYNSITSSDLQTTFNFEFSLTYISTN